MVLGEFGGLTDNTVGVMIGICIHVIGEVG